MYFSHLDTIFSQWTYLEEQLAKFLETYDDENRKRVQESIIDAIRSHPCSNFPVCPAFQRSIGDWVKNICDKYGCSVQAEFNSMSELREPKNEYIFKWYAAEEDDDNNSGLVLLEENRDPIGHGTTGLISWQGAIMLSCWSQTFTDFIKVI